MIVYGSSLSPFVRKLLVVADEKGLVMEVEPTAPNSNDPAFREASPFGKIPGFRDGAEVLHVVNPEDWARQGMIAGTPFALAHTFAQTGPFRPANTLRGIDNAVLAGSSTVPGVGVPTAMISGRLAADRITGIVDGSKRTVVAKAGRS